LISAILLQKKEFTMKNYSLLQYAIAYAKKDFKVFPLRPRQKTPIHNGGFKNATNDINQIRKWWEEYPNANIGIATGELGGGIFVVDLDVDEEKGIDGFHTLRDWERDNGNFPDTCQSITGRGGYHLFFKSNRKINSRTAIFDGIDIRGEGGYIVAPPSIHSNGKSYEWEYDLNDCEIASANEIVYSFLDYKEDNSSEKFTLQEIVPEGCRNSTFYKLACSLQAKGLSDDVIRMVVLDEANNRCIPKMSKNDIEELEKTIKSALKKEKGELYIFHDNKPLAKQFISLKTVEKNGVEKVIQSIDNCCTIIRQDESLNGKIKYNILSYSPFVFGSLPWEQKDTYREWNNTDDNNLMCYIENEYSISALEKIEKALDIVINENKYNPVIEMLEGIKWDGINRIENLLSDYLGVSKNEYTTEVMKLFMVGAVSRAYNPGCKFDYMPIFIGDQGVGKSAFLRALAGNDDWYSDNFNTIDGDKAAEKLRGMWIVEMAELLATKKAKDVEAIKAFITSTTDTYREPYARRTVQRPRICVFAGTTNNERFMTDTTGNRRYLPLLVNKSNVKKSLFDNIKDVENDFKQAWAEALYIYKNNDNKLIMPMHLQELVLKEQMKYLEEDTRVGIIQEYLDSITNNDFNICVMQIWEIALGMEGQKLDKRISNELHEIMKSSIIGWSRIENSNGGRSRASISKYGVQICYKKIVAESEFEPFQEKIFD
jgi:predicted P-loop ATPase